MSFSWRDRVWRWLQFIFWSAMFHFSRVDQFRTAAEIVKNCVPRIFKGCEKFEWSFFDPNGALLNLKQGSARFNKSGSRRKRALFFPRRPRKVRSRPERVLKKMLPVTLPACYVRCRPVKGEPFVSTIIPIFPAVSCRPVFLVPVSGATLVFLLAFFSSSFRISGLRSRSGPGSGWRRLLFFGPEANLCRAFRCSLGG